MPDTKGHILYDSISTKCPGQTNPQRRKADWWLPGPGAERGVTVEWGRGFHVGDKKDLELNSGGDGCTYC